MGIALTDRADLLAENPNKELQLILKIDGIDLIFGARDVGIAWRIGDDATIGQPDLVIGGIITDPESRDYISESGTTRQLTQQIQPDKESNSSVPIMNIRLVDKNAEVTKAFQPGNNVADILYRNAKIYSSFVGASHPEDSIPVLFGVVSDIEFGPGFVDVKISNPEQKKRQSIFQRIDTNLDGAIDSSQTSLVVNSTNGMFEPKDVLKTYVQIEDEIIEYSGISGNTLTGLSRGSLGTTASSHDNDQDVGTVYRFQDKPINLALKMMMSKSGVYNTQKTPAFQQLTPSLFVDNAIRFNENVKNTLGVVEGSIISISGATESSNNVTDAVVSEVVEAEFGSYVILDADLATETDSSAIASFKSQFDTLPDGCAMSPEDVDVEQFVRINNLFNASFPDYDFRESDTIDAKDFIDKEVFFPSGLFSVPRKAKTSVQYTLPPLSDINTKKLNEDNVIRPDQIKITRSINKNFYNTIVYKFDHDIVQDKFKSGIITEDNDSINRIQAGTRQLVIESKGLRNNASTQSFVTRQTQRFLNRFKFAAESLTIDVDYGTGFNMDVADTVILDGKELKISDVNTGDRSFLPRIMELVNINKNFVNGKVRINVLDTNFAIKGRFGVISPSSKVGTGASTTKIPLKVSFGTASGARESAKWKKYIGEKIFVHNPNFSLTDEVTLQGFDSVETESMVVSPALGFTPSENDIVDVANYPSSANKADNAIYKDVFCFFNPQVDVASGSSSTSFDVSSGDVSKFFVGAIIEVHTEDYSVVSPEVEVEDITSTTITVDKDLGFTPSPSMKVDFIGFADEGDPYRLV